MSIRAEPGRHSCGRRSWRASCEAVDTRSQDPPRAPRVRTRIKPANEAAGQPGDRARPACEPPWRLTGGGGWGARLEAVARHIV